MKIYEACEMLAKRQISSQEILESVVQEDFCNAFITRCEPKITDETLPLSGIPIAIKDNICTKDILTTAGSRMLSDFVPPYNATVVEKLSNSGCVTVGKANMDEFGMGSSGKHSFFGAVLNPINNDYITGGSSAGCAAAIRSKTAMGAIGSDTGGSVRQPAAFCGICALKPTYSLISRYGLIAFASSLDCVGVMANCVKDVAILTEIAAGYDEKDATSSRIEEKSYLKNLNTNIKNIKIGVPKEFYETADECVRKCIISAIKKLEEMGATVEECSMKTLKYATSAYYVISSAEAASNLARFDAVRYGYRTENYTSFEEMYAKSRSEAFGDEVKRRILLGTFVLSAEKHDIYNKAYAARRKIKTDFERLLSRYDVLITPVYPACVPRTDEKTDIEKEYERDNCTAAVSLAGLPAMSVPCGTDKNNMPIGMQLIGRAFSEQMLFNVASAYEEGTDKNV